MNGKLGNASESGLVEIPCLSAGIVQKSVSEADSDDVFARADIVGQVVFVIVYHVVGIGYVGGKTPLGYFFAVDIKLVKSQTANRHLGALTARQGKSPAEKRSGNVFFKFVLFI